MKILSVFFVLAFLSFCLAEIEPRFPGTQPIVIPGAPQSGVVTPAPPSSGADDLDDVIDVFTIDPFSFDSSPPVIVQLFADAPPNVSEFQSDVDPTILGGERDIEFTVTRGTTGLVFTAGAAGDTFNIATPNSGSGFVVLQYDGQDNSPDLDSTFGLGGLDFSAAEGFRIFAETDIDTDFALNVADSFGNTGSVESFVPGSAGEQSYFILFSEFPGNVDFQSITAIEFVIQAFDNVDFVMNTFVVFGRVVVVPPTDCITGVVLPCDTDYYRIATFDGVNPGDYLSIAYDDVGEVDHFRTTEGRFYIQSSSFTNLQEELASNNNIRDTTGLLPGPHNYEYRCAGNCDVEIAWSQLENTTYYLAVEGQGDGHLVYQICMAYRTVPIIELVDGSPEVIFFDQRPTYPPRDEILHYRFFSLDIPQSSFSEGTYMVVSITRAQPFPGVGLRLMYESLPMTAIDTGVIGAIDVNSRNRRVDDTIFQFCVDTTTNGRPDYDHPVATDPRVPCDCFTEVELFGEGPAFQLTCQLVVDPCQFRYGRWYMSVELPERVEPGDPFDLSGQTNYTITATTVSPSITQLIRNVTFKAFVEPEAVAHFKLEVPANTVVDGESHLLVHLSNVRNGIVDVYVHQGLGIGHNLAGGPEGCVPANATCRTCDACNVVIEKCHFVPGTWYISVGIARDDSDFLINDVDRLPITFTLRANWLEDQTPQRLVAGVPVAKYIGEALYDFYVIDVPPTIDTWLFVELYAKAENTEVVLAILHGDLPGGECYARPDFYCMTGDPLGKRFSYGTPAFIENDPVQRESCSFMIQTCELSPGPLYLSVYGHHTGYAAYGDTTFYQVPVHYTLWADFDVALSLQSGVSYSETVAQRQYQHYYIRADQVQQGSSLTVELTNIQNGIPQTLEAFVNYNYLAGNCPCYDHLYNCTGAEPCEGAVDVLSDTRDDVLNCCTINVPASDFRPGVWYIAVLGINEDYFWSTTPIGYTLTVTVNEAPEFVPLILGQAYQGEVPQWNTTLEYVHFRLAAEAYPLSDLVLKATWVQNCDFRGKHDDIFNNHPDNLWMYVNKGAPATEYLGGFVQRCNANVDTHSTCTVVIPHCEWEGDDWFVAIQGRYSADFIGRFTLRAFTEEVRDFQLTDGVSRYDRVAVGRHQHYFIETTAQEDQYLSIDLYVNQDQDAVTVYLNRDERAGADPCFNHFASCIAQTCCTWQLHACDLEPGRYYISVYGSHSQFYDTSVEYTLSAAHKPVTTLLFNGDPFTGHLKQVGDVNHYRFEVPTTVRLGTFLLFEVDNVKHGAVTVYGQSGWLAGRCPCFIWEHTCTASADPFGPASEEWCEIRVPSCQLQPGEYFFSVWGIESQSPDPPVFVTPIGYTLEVNLITPIIVDPLVVVGRDVANTEPFQFVANARYNHYQFSVDDDDFTAGHHVIVEITTVRDGALFVYYNQFVPGDEDTACHVAEICTSGLGAGAECFWQIPYCLARPLGSGNLHYITVEGRTGRVQASYNILIWKQGVPSYIANPVFTLDNGVNGIGGSNLTELDISHSVNHEPNQWTQFIRLEDVPARLDHGELLEVFFYRVTNNPGDDLSFDVYLHPNEPAGPHECCDSDPVTLGSCQGAPCSNTVDTIISSSGGFDVVSHTCELGAGQGHDGNGDPLFGERCIVRVFPCEFNKYCANETRDWFMTVIPHATPNLGATGAGLTYSTQWRVRDVRLTENQSVGSIDLTPSINTYQYTQTYSVVSATTESQGWLSFFVDSVQNNTRLSIQTQFTQGSGLVYIGGDDTTCEYYTCSTGEDCNGDGRFYVSECCAHKSDRYFITFRNIGAVGSTASVQFRIVETYLPETFEIEDHPTAASPFRSSSGPSVYPGVSGIEGDNYDFYVLIIDDDDLDNSQSWVVDVSRPANDVGELDVYIRFGAEAGPYGPDNAQSAYGNSDEGCHGFMYSCNLANALDRCLFQIPYCELIEGFWYISIHNPNFNFDSVPTNLPDYNLVTYISDPPLALALEEHVTSLATADSALLQHFSFNITEADIDFDDRADYEGYWTRYLRFQLDQVGGSGTATMYVNYGSLAGPEGQDNCVGNFQQVTCGNTQSNDACFVDVTPCEFDGADLKLKTGVYYVSVRHDADTRYSLVTRILSDLYAAIPLTETIVGSGNRLGVVDDLYSYTVTDSELNVRGDGEDNYRYVIDIPGVDDDDLADNEYFVFNFTAAANTLAGEQVHFEIWRDDCTRYECDLTGPRSWCTVDALELAPCSAKAGRFFIRAENPSQVTFTIDLYHNETVVQRITDRQIITEIVYPYEYQEYFYDAVSVGEGAALSVTVCSICGDVEAFIRPDLPAGPVADNTGYEKSCSIDYCRASGPEDTSFEGTNNCCEIFLDTCQYEQRGYYIGVRGVNQVYPNERNEHLYIPAKYTIQPAQHNVNITDLSFASCPKTVNYYASWAQVPRQYAIDIETINVGAMLRFSMRLPSSFYTSPAAPATLYVQANQTVGYTDGCPLDDKDTFEGALSCTTTTSCDFIIPYCKLKQYCGARYYLWADAPRGTEILVERWDPTVPILHNDVHYQASINAPGPAVTWDTPFTPNRQIYRFELDPKLYDDANYYEKFFVRVILSNVEQGTVSFTVNSGYSPYVDGTGCDESPLFLDTSSCSSVGAGEECWVEMQYSTLLALAGGQDCDIPKTYWLTVHGESQDCELHSVKYDFVVQTHWTLTYYPIGETICNTVEENQYNFHRLRPRAVESPQESILRISIEDLDVGESVSLLVNDNFLAADHDNHFTLSTGASGSLETEYICGYDDLYLSVYGDSSVDGVVDYRMTVEKVHIRVKDLMDKMVHHEDDDDDDACPTPHDFYRFRTAWPHGHHDGAFFRVLVDSEFPTQVYVNKNDFAWEGCADSGYGENNPDITGTTSVNVYDFCDFQDGTYFITVVSDGPYYIYTEVRDDAKELTLGEVFRDELEPGQYQMYTLDICDGWTEADDRLVIEIADAQNGNVQGWIRGNHQNPGDPTEFGYNTCSEGHAFADYGAGESGYDFLLVDHCSLETGHYHILIRADPHEGSPERNCEHVTFRLYPYLIDYQIDPVEIFPNTPIVDSVDFWTVNRINPDSVPFARYYEVNPLMEDQGFYEQISHAVARVSNVEGGLLHVKVMCDKLAISEWAYIDGEIYGLVSNSADDLDFDADHGHDHDGLLSPANKMQSGRFPFIYQNVMDHRESEYQPECLGCSDFCCSMTFDDLDQYTKDKSCAIWIPSCYLIWKHFYISVEPIVQFAEDHPVSYTLQFDHTRDYRLLQPDHHSVNSFINDNWDYDFFYSISAEPQSMRWRVVVTEGEGVLVTVRNHRCPLQSTWTKEVWCDADYFDRPWMCDIEIPTRAAHPGDNAFFVSVYGKNATYSIAFWRGRENCHDFTGSGRTEGLDFCAGLVPYTTWRWDSYHNLDQEAKCFFEDLYQHFRVQPCYTGVTPECNATLASFACHESFRKCDEQGFFTGTCRDSCEAVVYECANWFETVDLEHYNCTSSRYLDSNAQVCTGNPAFSSISSVNHAFLGDEPDLLLFKSSPSSSSTTLSVSVLVTFVLAIFALAF